MPVYEVRGWSKPEAGIRAPKDLTIGSLAEMDADAVALTGGTILGPVVAAFPAPAVGAVAAGTVQGDAVALAASLTAFATVGAGTGARLAAGVAGVPVMVFNGGANALLVYPAAGGQINALGANAAFSVGAGKSAIFVPTAAGQWFSHLGA